MVGVETQSGETGMNIGETNNYPTNDRPIPSRDAIEPAHAKAQVEQVETETRDAVSAVPTAPDVGKFVDINA